MRSVIAVTRTERPRYVVVRLLANAGKRVPSLRSAKNSPLTASSSASSASTVSRSSATTSDAMGMPTTSSGAYPYMFEKARFALTIWSLSLMHTPSAAASASTRNRSSLSRRACSASTCSVTSRSDDWISLTTPVIGSTAPWLSASNHMMAPSRVTARNRRWRISSGFSKRVSRSANRCRSSGWMIVCICRPVCCAPGNPSILKIEET